MVHKQIAQAVYVVADRFVTPISKHARALQVDF